MSRKITVDETVLFTFINELISYDSKSLIDVLNSIKNDDIILTTKDFKKIIEEYLVDSSEIKSQVLSDLIGKWAKCTEEFGEVLEEVIHEMDANDDKEETAM